MKLGSLGVRAQVEELGRLSGILAEVVSEAGNICTEAALVESARRAGTAVSEMRYALTFATHEGIVHRDRAGGTLHHEPQVSDS